MNTTVSNSPKFTERYPDADLQEFRQIIQDNYKDAKEALENLRNQIRDYSARAADDFGADYGDDSNTNSEIEMLSDMAVRTRNRLRDLCL